MQIGVVQQAGQDTNQNLCWILCGYDWNTGTYGPQQLFNDREGGWLAFTYEDRMLAEKVVDAIGQVCLMLLSTGSHGMMHVVVVIADNCA